MITTLCLRMTEGVEVVDAAVHLGVVLAKKDIRTAVFNFTSENPSVLEVAVEPYPFIEALLKPFIALNPYVVPTDRADIFYAALGTSVKEAEQLLQQNAHRKPWLHLAGHLLALDIDAVVIACDSIPCDSMLWEAITLATDVVIPMSNVQKPLQTRPEIDNEILRMIVEEVKENGWLGPDVNKKAGIAMLHSK